MKNLSVEQALVSLLLGLMLVAAGCAGKPPGVRYYGLAPLVSAEAASPGALQGRHPSIEVGPVELPQALNREQLVTRSSAHRLIIHQSHRWAGSLDKDLTAVLVRNLSGLLGTDRVAPFGETPLEPADYRVMLNIEQFDGAPGESVTLKARWTILSPARKKILRVGRSDIREPLAGGGFEELVQGQSRAVGQLSREIARELAGVNRGG